MDSFELNKIMGAILGTLLFALSLSIVSGGIFASHPPQKAGYEIAVKEEKAGEKKGPAEPQVPFANLLAEANAEKGASVARQCVACHEFAKGGPNKVGPNLWGTVEREIASVSGFNYSNAMKNKKGKWTFEELDKFLENPNKAVPGTSMTFMGIRRGTDRAAVIAYMNRQSDAPAPLPQPVAVSAPEGQTKDAPNGAQKKDAAPPSDAQKKDAQKKDAGQKKDATPPTPAKDSTVDGQKKDAPAEKKDDAPVDPAQPQTPKPDGTGQTK